MQNTISKTIPCICVINQYFSALFGPYKHKKTTQVDGFCIIMIFYDLINTLHFEPYLNWHPFQRYQLDRQTCHCLLQHRQ